jgi:hypothetical protein
MAVTKFKITRAPNRATLNILGVAFVLNQEYSIFNENSMTVEAFERGVSYDDFGFKLGNENGIWSPEYKCTINAHVNTGTPISVSFEVDTTLYKEIDITDDFIFDDKTDRVWITEMTPVKGTMTVNGNPVIFFKPYRLYLFKNVKFVPYDDIDSQNSTTVVSFRVGNDTAIEPTVYTVTLRATSNIAARVECITETTGIL